MGSESLPFAAPGGLIGEKYRVERVLGRGGMGIVLAARHLDLGTEVAIKVLLPGAAASPDSATRFLREGRASARLTSPYVAKVFDTGRLATGEPYLVMELLRGRDLKEILEESGYLPLADAIGWTIEAAEALREAHSIGIVHRDIKPANLFIAETPYGRHVKVVDFGISKQNEPGDVNLTGSMACMGTPRYMAPEQMRSSKMADARSDVWALGIVLYELTTGRKPFDGDDVVEIIMSITETNPTQPSLLNPALPAGFDRVVLTCLAKQPADRFQTMDALIAALRAVTLEAPAVVYPPPLASMARHPQPSHAHGLTPAAGLTPHPGIGQAPAETMQSWNTPGRSEPAAAKPNRAGYAILATLFVAIGGSLGAYAWTRAAKQHAQPAPAAEAPATANASSLPVAGPVVSEASRASSAPSASASAPVISLSTAVASAAPSAPPGLPGQPATASGSVPQAPDSHRVNSPVAAPPPFIPPAPQPVPPPAAPAANCNPPFTVDATGMKHAKPECL